MEKNALPHYDDSINTTGCCPKFNPEGWDEQVLHFEGKLFVRGITISFLHIPINMGSVFKRIFNHIEKEGAHDPDDFIVLSRDLSPWKAEHLFAVSKPVVKEETIRLSGDYITKVYDGPYRRAKQWYDEMKQLAKAKSGQAKEVYFFYTTCPKCSKAYGHNYMVAVAEI